MQTEQPNSVAEMMKLITASMILVISLSVFYIFAEITPVIRVPGLLFAFAAALALLFTTKLGKTFWAFALESKQEFRRITWPTRDEAVRTTLLVILMVFVVGIILWLLDMFLFWGVQFVMSQGIK